MTAYAYARALLDTSRDKARFAEGAALLTADDVSALVLVEPEGLKWYIVHHRCGGSLAKKMSIRIATSGTVPEGARLQ